MPASRASAGDGLATCDRPLAEVYDGALYDLDGVLYVGPGVVPHAATAVAAARAAGMRAAFVTNNASRRPSDVATHLSDLGIPALPGDVVTSAQAAARLLVERIDPGAVVLVLGSPGLAAEIEAVGFPTVREAVPAVAAVVQGYDSGTGWSQLAEACIAVRAGAFWVAANTDATLPSPRGPVPGNGALVAALRTATGREPVVAGKPETALNAESVDRLGAQRPLVVGDRLDTDILGAVRSGLDSLLVLTGVSDLTDALSAPRGCRPSFVSRDLRGLHEPHPAVEVDPSGERARCAGAEAQVVRGDLEVDGSSSAGLRAGCALAWHRADTGVGAAGLVRQSGAGRYGA